MSVNPNTRRMALGIMLRNLSFGERRDEGMLDRARERLLIDAQHQQGQADWKCGGLLEYLTARCKLQTFLSLS